MSEEQSNDTPESVKREVDDALERALQTEFLNKPDGHTPATETGQGSKSAAAENPS